MRSARAASRSASARSARRRCASRASVRVLVTQVLEQLAELPPSRSRAAFSSDPGGFSGRGLGGPLPRPAGLAAAVLRLRLARRISASGLHGPDVVVAFSLGSSDALLGLAADPLDLGGVGGDGVRRAGPCGRLGEQGPPAKWPAGCCSSPGPRVVAASGRKRGGAAAFGGSQPLAFASRRSSRLSPTHVPT